MYPILPQGLVTPITLEWKNTQIKTKGLIDTGASKTIITREFKEKLGLQYRALTKYGGIGLTQGNMPLYDIFFIVNGKRFKVRVGSLMNKMQEAYLLCQIAPAKILIGRDVLKHLVLKVDGPAGNFSIK